MAKAVTLNNNWRQTQLMREDNSAGSFPNSKNGCSYQFQPQTDCNPMAMDIDAVINTLSPEERQDLMKRGACFFCKKSGNRFKDCNKKPSLNRSGNSGNRGNQGKNQSDYQSKNNDNKAKKFISNKAKEITKHIYALVNKLKDEEYTIFNQSMIEEGLFELEGGSDNKDNKDF